MQKHSAGRSPENYVLDPRLPIFIRENTDLYLGSLAAVDRINAWDRRVHGDNTDAFKFFLEAQLKALWSKNHVRPYEGDLEAEAIDAFWRCEERNALINRSLLKFGLDHFEADAHIINRARELIHKAIGPEPFTLSDLRITTGASVSTKRSSSTVLHKIEDGICATQECLDFASEHFLDHECTVYGSWPYLFEALKSNGVRLVDGNVFHTVPKQWNKLRPIATEPSFNGMIQTSIAARIKTALRRSFGVNISRQQKRHAYLVREKACEIATIDLSNASDLISYELVRLLFEDTPIWNALRASRSPTTDLGEWFTEPVYLDKYASMGNGCTFELETLIFAALQRAVFETRRYDKKMLSLMGTYGDDMIVPKALAPVLIRVLERCGFTINLDKSFITGPFKESCGVDYYDGFDVRPLFFRYDSETKGLHGLANTYAMVWYPLELSMRLYGCIVSELLEISKQALSFIPANLQFFGPLLHNKGEYRFLYTTAWLPGLLSHYEAYSNTFIESSSITHKVTDDWASYQDFLAYNEYRLSMTPVIATLCEHEPAHKHAPGNRCIVLRDLALQAKSLDVTREPQLFTQEKGSYWLHSTAKVRYRLKRRSKRTLCEMITMHRRFGGLEVLVTF